MLGWLGKIAYPVFGMLVLLGYLRVVRGGIEPFEASSEQHAIPSASRQGVAGGGMHYRSPTVFHYGGFGGK